MYAAYEQVKDQNYRPNEFKIMLDRKGAFETAQRCVLNADGVPSGVFLLMKLGIPEISVEAVVVEYEDLFADTPEMIAAAKERLQWMENSEAQARDRELRGSIGSPTSR